MIFDSFILKDPTLDTLCDALSNWGARDNDFDGSNGLEYVSEEAIAAGYESNCDYEIAKLKTKYEGKPLTPEVIDAIVNEFLSAWLDHDSYYGSFEYGVEVEDNYVFASFAVIDTSD